MATRSVAIIVFPAVLALARLEDWQASKKNGHPKVPAWF